ncbi:MAG: lipase family protein [Solirubrobacteraceae bacterium]|nr:MAG: hypothetical protein DLM63_04530 [Solirubrobacterales bacterium]
MTWTPAWIRSAAPTLLGVAALGLICSPAGAAPLSPTVDPFYQAPAGLDAVAPGTVLRTRAVTVTLGPVPLSGLLAKAYQLLYRTNGASGRAVPGVTTVLVPNAGAPAGGRQLVSVDDAEDSVDPNCAPSYQLQNGEQGDANLALETGLATTELTQGRAIVIPDAEGPQSEYIVTGMEGHAALDSIRAVEHFPLAGLSGMATKVGLIGYSGGAHVTAAADELAPSYAPELNLVGVAEGGVPVGNEDTVSYINGSIGAGVLMATAIALDRAYPELDLPALLNAKGRAFAQQVSTGCASSVFAAPFANYDSYTNTPDVFHVPRVERVINLNALGHNSPTAPTFVYNGIHDELIWIKPLDDLVAHYCQAGARIDYFRDPLGLEHIQGVANFTLLAIPYLTGRFNGDPVPDTCGAPAGSTTPASGSVAPRHKSTRCTSARVIVLHPRVPAGFSVRRLEVLIAGRVVSSTRRHVRSIRVSIADRRSGRLAIELRITASRRHHRITLYERRSYRLCGHAQRR